MSAVPEMCWFRRDEPAASPARRTIPHAREETVFTVASTVCENSAAKRRNWMQRHENQLPYGRLWKTRCARSWKTAQKTLLKLQISRSGTNWAMPAFPIRKLFLASWSRAFHWARGWKADCVCGTRISDSLAVV